VKKGDRIIIPTKLDGKLIKAMHRKLKPAWNETKLYKMLY
jgi:hypothetical protein